jgi:hypothetical protein
MFKKLFINLHQTGLKPQQTYFILILAVLDFSKNSFGLYDGSFKRIICLAWCFRGIIEQVSFYKRVRVGGARI